MGEVIGALAVIITLFYLAHQIKQNSRALERSNAYAQANSIHQINAMFSGIDAHLAADGGLAEIYSRALAGEQLATAEEVRFIAFVNMYVAAVENLAGQQGLDLGFAELDSDSAVALMAPQLRKLLSTEAGARWWRESGPVLYVEEFRQQVDAAIA